MKRFTRHSKKVFIGIIGAIVTLVGLVMVPYPGPGWLIVFGGLAILATEFEFARKWLEYGREKYEAWKKWLLHQRRGIQILVLCIISSVTIITIWLLNGFGIIDNFLNLDIEWVHSPLFR
ncbi:MAG TPA: TIGR02611 family protein [Candidatus Saccharimonadales bacterium]|nr:TIGR02611 family protein [Candidatus Saccharimonadales bacterium]